MVGLLDWMQTPQGIGLLSAVAGGFAGARRGTPLNNVGRGLVAGLTGYQSANDQIRQDQENALVRQYKEMQMQQIQRQIEEKNAERAWKAKLPEVMAAAQPKVEQFTPDDPFSEGAAAFGQLYGGDQHGQQASGLMANVTPGNPQALQEYLMQPDSPYADKLIEQQIIPKPAKWTVVERYNENTGMPEKVLMDENNPSDIRQFGGAQADTVVADNLGGQLVYRGSRSATPLGMLDKTATPDALMTDARTRAEGAANRAVSIRGQNLTDARARESNSNANSRAPAGYRFNAEGNLEVIPGGPADAKELARREGGNTVDTVIATLRDQYDQLEKGGGIVSTNQDVASNIGARVSSSGLGQLVGGTIGTKNQSARDTVAQTRPVLLQAIMKATGMSAKQMDSNVELKLYLATATDPTLGLEANRNALAMIEKLYGSGSRAKSSDTPTSDRYQEYLDAFKRAKTPEQRRAITERARQNGVVK